MINGESDLRTIRLRSLRDILASPGAAALPVIVVPYLAWQGRVTLLAGREKLGKSTLATAAAATVSRGGSFLGEPCESGEVLWVLAEEHEQDCARRAHEFHANIDRFHVLEPTSDVFADLVAAVEAVSPVLIVIDTLATFTSGLIDDPSVSTGWIPVMQKLSRLARSSSSALVAVHHARKSDGTYRDSTAIAAGVDVLVQLEGGNDTMRRLKARGRWRVQDFTVNLTPSGFTLVGGKLSLEDRIVAYVRTNQGASSRQLRDGIQARGIDVRAAVKRLLTQGRLRNTGSDREHAYQVVEREEPEDSQ